MALFRMPLGWGARKTGLALAEPVARPRLPAMRLLVLDELVAFVLGARCRVVGHRWECQLRTAGQAYYQCRWCRRTQVVG